MFQWVRVSFLQCVGGRVVGLPVQSLSNLTGGWPRRSSCSLPDVVSHGSPNGRNIFQWVWVYLCGGGGLGLPGTVRSLINLTRGWLRSLGYCWQAGV